MKLGTILPVWKEYRYLSLVLDQMLLCPGPKLVVWQDKPLHWLGNGPAPSGHNHHKTAEILDRYKNKVEIWKIDRSPDVNHEFGGFKWIQQESYRRLREEHGVEAIFWQDSDWLFDLDELRAFFGCLDDAPVDGKLWSVPTQHYWRDFDHTMSKSPVTIVYPSTVDHHWKHYEEEDMHRMKRPFLYHAAYVLSDAEMYDKIHSWGHAPEFKAEGFYEKVWIGRDEAERIKPEKADVYLPATLTLRLAAAGATLER